MTLSASPPWWHTVRAIAWRAFSLQWVQTLCPGLHKNTYNPPNRPTTSFEGPPFALLPVMPSISSGKVLVTGANGFIAAWVVHDLLEHGFSVRGSVRSDSKATYLRDHFGTYGDKFEVKIVKDMTMVRGHGHVRCWILTCRLA